MTFKFNMNWPPSLSNLDLLIPSLSFMPLQQHWPLHAVILTHKTCSHICTFKNLFLMTEMLFTQIEIHCFNLSLYINVTFSMELACVPQAISIPGTQDPHHTKCMTFYYAVKFIIFIIYCLFLPSQIKLQRGRCSYLLCSLTDA